MRDRALLAVLVACVLRRGELSRMNSERLAMRDGRWVFLDFLGKGNKVRLVAVPRFKGCATAAMVNSDQTGSSHSSCSLPNVPRKVPLTPL
jgi:site-specific recombinase XerC